MKLFKNERGFWRELCEVMGHNNGFFTYGGHKIGVTLHPEGPPLYKLELSHEEAYLLARKLNWLLTLSGYVEKDGSLTTTPDSDCRE